MNTTSPLDIGRETSPFVLVSPLFIGVLLNVVGTFIFVVAGTFPNYYVRNGLICSSSGLEMLSLNFASPATVSPLCALIIFWTLVFDWKNTTRVTIAKGISMIIGITLSLSHIDQSKEEVLTLLNWRGIVMLLCGCFTIGFRYFYYIKKTIEEPLLLPGIIGGFTNVSAKLFINYAKTPDLWGCFLMAILCIVFGYNQLKALNIQLDIRGLVKTNPLYISSLIISIVIWNSVTFDENVHITFILGCAIIIAAVMYE